MEEFLKGLLEAEKRAESQVEEANREQERIIQQAREEARSALERFEARIAELRAPYLTEAEERIEIAVAELKKKYKERKRILRDLASQNEDEAIEAALDLILGSRGH